MQQYFHIANRFQHQDERHHVNRNHEKARFRPYCSCTSYQHNLIIQGGFIQDSSSYDPSIQEFNLGSFTWKYSNDQNQNYRQGNTNSQQGQTSLFPQPRCNAAFCCNEKDGSIYLYGGNMGTQKRSHFFDLWEHEIGRKEWNRLPCAAYISTHNEMQSVKRSSCQSSSEVCDQSKDLDQFLSISHIPISRAHGVLLHHPNQSKLILFGGVTSIPSNTNEEELDLVNVADLYEYDLMNRVWKRVALHSQFIESSKLCYQDSQKENMCLTPDICSLYFWRRECWDVNKNALTCSQNQLKSHDKEEEEEYELCIIHKARCDFNLNKLVIGISKYSLKNQQWEHQFVEIDQILKKYYEICWKHVSCGYKSIDEGIDMAYSSEFDCIYFVCDWSKHHKCKYQQGDRSGRYIVFSLCMKTLQLKEFPDVEVKSMRFENNKDIQSDVTAFDLKESGDEYIGLCNNICRNKKSEHFSYQVPRGILTHLTSASMFSNFLVSYVGKSDETIITFVELPNSIATSTSRMFRRLSMSAFKYPFCDTLICFAR